MCLGRAPEGSSTIITFQEAAQRMSPEALQTRILNGEEFFIIEACGVVGGRVKAMASLREVMLQHV